jgi:hypothetical protein
MSKHARQLNGAETGPEQDTREKKGCQPTTHGSIVPSPSRCSARLRSPAHPRRESLLVTPSLLDKASSAAAPCAWIRSLDEGAVHEDLGCR